MTLEIRNWLSTQVNEFKHSVDFGPIAARRQKRAGWQVQETGIAGYIDPGGTYLDIGSGKGYIRRAIEGLQPDVTVYGVDLLDRPTKRMRRATSPTFSYADATHLPYPDKSFDGTSMFFVFHHMPYENHELVIQENKRVVRTGGFILIAEDIVDGVGTEQWDVTERADHRFNPDFGRGLPHNFRTKCDWEELFWKNGLSILDEVDYKTGNVNHTFFALREY